VQNFRKINLKIRKFSTFYRITIKNSLPMKKFVKIAEKQCRAGDTGGGFRIPGRQNTRCKQPEKCGIERAAAGAG
jgi:hypothetical protein